MCSLATCSGRVTGMHQCPPGHIRNHPAPTRKQQRASGSLELASFCPFRNCPLATAPRPLRPFVDRDLWSEVGFGGALGVGWEVPWSLEVADQEQNAMLLHRGFPPPPPSALNRPSSIRTLVS